MPWGWLTRTLPPRTSSSAQPSTSWTLGWLSCVQKVGDASHASPLALKLTELMLLWQ